MADLKKTSNAFKTPYDELETFLKSESHLHIDETSFKKNGKLQWAWCFVAGFFTFFKIDPSRGSKVLKDTLGDDFLGSISSDFFSAYLKYKKETQQGDGLGQTFRGTRRKLFSFHRQSVDRPDEQRGRTKYPHVDHGSHRHARHPKHHGQRMARTLLDRRRHMPKSRTKRHDVFVRRDLQFSS